MILPPGTNPAKSLHRSERQREYLAGLQARVGLSYREMAKRSQAPAHGPDLAFTHQAISKWFRGASQPSEKGRKFLSSVFQVDQTEIDRECGVLPRPAAENAASVIVHAFDLTGSPHHYALRLRNAMDLSQPALLEDWVSLFVGRPGGLSRHFKSLSGRLCGYTPVVMRPYINHPRSVVLIETEHKAFDQLESPNKKLWFVYLPDGSLELGLLFAEPQGRNVILAKPGEKASKWRRFHRDQVDRVGFVGNRLLFCLDPVEG
jgi:transcriptional regulator with XRE-family HTH domain